MKPITINPLSEHGEVHTAYLIDETHAIHSDGLYVSLVEVKPADEPDTYTPTERGNYITVASGRARSAAALEKIVKQLHHMTAYELITQHYDHREYGFLINQQRGTSSWRGIQ